jgi:hypothetical protein
LGEWDEFQEISFHHLAVSFKNGTRTSADVCPAGGKRGKELFLPCFYIKSAFIRVIPPPIPQVSGGWIYARSSNSSPKPAVHPRYSASYSTNVR